MLKPTARKIGKLRISAVHDGYDAFSGSTVTRARTRACEYVSGKPVISVISVMVAACRAAGGPYE